MKLLANRSALAMAGLLAVMAMATLFPGVAHADILGTAENAITNVYETAKTIVYIVGGLGIIVLAIFAFFGRFKWTHFFALAGGLFLVAGTAELIDFVGGDSSGI